MFKLRGHGPLRSTVGEEAKRSFLMPLAQRASVGSLDLPLIMKHFRLEKMLSFSVL